MPSSPKLPTRLPRQRRLLPLLLADCTPPARIATLTYADFRDEAARGT